MKEMKFPLQKSITDLELHYNISTIKRKEVALVLHNITQIKICNTIKFFPIRFCEKKKYRVQLLKWEIKIFQVLQVTDNGTGLIQSCLKCYQIQKNWNKSMLIRVLEQEDPAHYSSKIKVW